jgi:secondary thiamine-phosphate synthase enzyme
MGVVAPRVTLLTVDSSRLPARHVKLTVQTKAHREFRDVTAEVRAAVRNAGLVDGLCALYVTHTTAGLTINENADPDVVDDLLRWVEDVLGDERRFKHYEGNTGGHVMSSLFGCSLTIPVERGDLALGRWQAIYLVEGDGPRERTLHVTLL